jgi:hypothetical protein
MRKKKEERKGRMGRVMRELGKFGRMGKIGRMGKFGKPGRIQNSALCTLHSALRTPHSKSTDRHIHNSGIPTLLLQSTAKNFSGGTIGIGTGLNVRTQARIG